MFAIGCLLLMLLQLLSNLTLSWVLLNGNVNQTIHQSLNSPVELFLLALPHDVLFALWSLVSLSVLLLSMATTGLDLLAQMLVSHRGPCGRNFRIICNDSGLNSKSKGRGIFFGMIISGGFLGGRAPLGPDLISQSFLSGVMHALYSPMNVRKFFFSLGGTLEQGTWLIARWQVSKQDPLMCHLAHILTRLFQSGRLLRHLALKSSHILPTTN
jgi:hypothetical protein